MPNLTLISHALRPHVQHAVIAPTLKFIPHECRCIKLADKSDWLREILLMRKMPLLQVGEEMIFKSAVICEHSDEITPGSSSPPPSSRYRWVL